MEEKYKEIKDLLYKLGLTANYRGFFYVSYAIELSIEKEERLLLVTKWLYPEVAKRYGTNWKAVEQSIRTANCIMWWENQALLEDLAGRGLEVQPLTAQLLAILAAEVKRERPQAKHSQPRNEGVKEVVK
ncbi:MAG: sporulation protein [Lawsonibacter sp.]|nr:sporulation protein [Lawsonibacter sp.]